MNKLERERALIAFLMAISQSKDFEFDEATILNALSKVAPSETFFQDKHYPEDKNRPNGFVLLRLIRGNLNKFNALASDLLDKRLNEEKKYQTEQEIKTLSKTDFKNFNDYDLTKSKLHELMCDKKLGVNIALSKIFQLGKDGHINTIVSNDRGDMKFSVKSALQWAQKYDKKM